MALPSDANQVLDFWFGAPAEAGYGSARVMWSRKSEATDLDITERFATWIEQALRGELSAWAAQPHSALVAGVNYPGRRHLGT